MDPWGTPISLLRKGEVSQPTLSLMFSKKQFAILTSIRDKADWEMSIGDGSKVSVWLMGRLTIILTEFTKYELRKVAVYVAPLIREPLSLISRCFIILLCHFPVNSIIWSQICLWFPLASPIRLRKKFALATRMSFVTLFLREVKMYLSVSNLVLRNVRRAWSVSFISLQTSPLIQGRVHLPTLLNILFLRNCFVLFWIQFICVTT